jgi:cobalamin biosynthesis protein CobD/CbiB
MVCFQSLNLSNNSIGQMGIRYFAWELSWCQGVEPGGGQLGMMMMVMVIMMMMSLTTVTIVPIFVDIVPNMVILSSSFSLRLLYHQHG